MSKIIFVASNMFYLLITTVVKDIMPLIQWLQIREMEVQSGLGSNRLAALNPTKILRYFSQIF